MNKHTPESVENIAKLREDRDTLLAACKRIVKWLDRLTEQAEKQASDIRFESLREACEADAKNYRATANHVRAAIRKAEGEEAHNE